jgi:hypothetical protein
MHIFVRRNKVVDRRRAISHARERISFFDMRTKAVLNQGMLFLWAEVLLARGTFSLRDPTMVAIPQGGDRDAT